MRHVTMGRGGRHGALDADTGDRDRVHRRGVNRWMKTRFTGAAMAEVSSDLATNGAGMNYDKKRRAQSSSE